VQKAQEGRDKGVKSILLGFLEKSQTSFFFFSYARMEGATAVWLDPPTAEKFCPKEESGQKKIK
jgi:hypothetical protein